MTKVNVPAPPLRAAAFAAINGERNYQDQKWPQLDPSQFPSVLEYLVYMEDYIKEAQHFYSRNPNETARTFALHTVRKVGAMAVACMEQNGTMWRDQEGPRPVGYSE